MTRGTQMTHHRRPTNPYTKNSAGQPKPLMMKGAVTYAQTVPAVAPAGQVRASQAGTMPSAIGTEASISSSPQLLLQSAAACSTASCRGWLTLQCLAQPLRQFPLVWRCNSLSGIDSAASWVVTSLPQPHLHRPGCWPASAAAGAPSCW